MATPKINENSDYVQNGPHKCEIKLEKFLFISCAVLELLRKVSQGGGIRPPGEIGLKRHLNEKNLIHG